MVTYRWTPIKYCPSCRIAARPHHYISHFGKVYEVCNACGERREHPLPQGLRGWLAVRRYAKWLNHSCIPHQC